MTERKKMSRHREAGSESAADETAARPQCVRALPATNPRLAKAVALLARNCGPGARQTLRSGHPALTTAAILTLARTAPEYQRHVLGRVRAGHARPLHKTAACALVYETVAFREVISRVERALGALRLEVAYLAAQAEAGVAELDRGPDRLLTLALVAETAAATAAGIRSLPNVEGVPCSYRRAGQAQFGPARGAAPKLHAASTLGLIAKNARNVPLLKPEHRPTALEQSRALDLYADTAALARTALRSARKRWGDLGTQVRVRPAGASTRRVVTYADPDGDALAAAWLAERYLFAGEAVEVLFVPRARVLGCLGLGDCLVGVGNTLDPARHLFDHQPPALASRHDACAAKLVWEHLLSNGKAVGQLEELILAVFACDSVKHRGEYARKAADRKRDGFYAAVDAAQRQGLNNADRYRCLRAWLDREYPPRG